MSTHANSLRETCDRQNRRHPDLISLKAGALIQLRAYERDIQKELEPWQRRHTDPPAEEPRRVGRQQRARGRYTKQLLRRPHDYWPPRNRVWWQFLARHWPTEWLPPLVSHEHYFLGRSRG